MKNAGLGFAIPYLNNRQKARVPAGLHRALQESPAFHLILEKKGFDPLADVKKAAAERWVAAVNAGGGFGKWEFALARLLGEVREVLARLSTV